MAKEFCPIIYRDWKPLFDSMSEHERSELLMAIVLFPSYTPDEVSTWEFFRQQLEKQYDFFTEKCNKNRAIAVAREERKKTLGERTCTNVNERTPKPEYKPEYKSKPNIKTYSTHPSDASPRQKVPSIKKPDGISPEDWDAFLKLRKQKRLPLTQKALDLMLKEASKANLSPQQMIDACLEHSWAGFKADWDRGQNSRESIEEAFLRECEEEERQKEMMRMSAL